MKCDELSEADIDLIDLALGMLSSDYNDVDHDAIAELRERLKPQQQCNDFGALINGGHACQLLYDDAPDNASTPMSGIPR